MNHCTCIWVTCGEKRVCEKQTASIRHNICSRCYVIQSKVKTGRNKKYRLEEKKKHFFFIYQRNRI